MLAFWLTCLLEAPWWILGLRAFGAWRRGSLGWLSAVGVAVGVNLLTHPVVWRLAATRDLPVWIAAEVGAVVVEFALVGLLLHCVRAASPWTTAVLLSLGANATTALVGVLFF